jgi:DNA polymerase-1
MPRLVVLDAMNLAYRAYYAFIRRPLVNSKNENTSAIFGFANSVLKIRKEEKPDYWALAWDGPGETFRHQTFREYKATRKPMPDDLAPQIEPISRVAEALGLPLIQLPGMEADDVMATLACRGEKDGFDVVLVTSDKDMLQLVTDKVTILAPSGRPSDEYIRMDADAVQTKWGVSPLQTRDVLAIMGDTSDNVPGVKGIGEKGAVDLIKAYGSLEELYRRLEEITKPALRQKLETSREQAFLSRELVTVKTDCELPLSWDQLKMQPIRRDALRELSKRWELIKLEQIANTLRSSEAGEGPPLPASAAERAAGKGGAKPPPPPDDDPWGPPPPPPSAAPPTATAQGALDLFAGLEAAGSLAVATSGSPRDLSESEAEARALLERAQSGLALLPLYEGEHPRRAQLVGLALAAREGPPCYLPLGHEGAANLESGRLRALLGEALADPAVPKLGEDLKRDSHLFECAGLALALPGEGELFDTHVLSFLCDPERDHSLEATARDFLALEVSREPPPPPGRKPKTKALPIEAGAYAARAAATLFPLVEALRAQLEARDQWELYRRLERPLIPTLFDMERAGIGLDPEILREMSSAAGEEIDSLRRELHLAAGEEINLDSGPQVAKVLFQTLGLKGAGRTPGGALSTRQEVLEELAEEHPFAARLLEYRALTKLRSTYFDALPQEIDARDGRVHTLFEQAGAATGRLSSSHPNLQNIPMRTERGRKIRRAFVAPVGRVFVGADYSQIELRVMAHLSQDPALIAAFESGEDIHDSTARRIFGVTGPLSPELRSRAKVANFGLMYGMGARTLAKGMGLGMAEAKEFIAHYFRAFEGVRAFLDGVVEEARERRWVATLLGRRRYLPGLESSHGGERAYAERIAINTPIQGSAADLMKLAMIRVHAALLAEFPSARLLLQVHDELLIECGTAEADAVAARVRAEMEGCFPLRVPLVVSVGRGTTWFDAH